MRRYAAILLLLAGCDLYFGGDDGPPCADWKTGGGAVAPDLLRNPETGLCETGGGSGGGCYDYEGECGPCAYDIAQPAQRDWGSCYSVCEGLDEQSCLGASGCIAAYDENTDYADAPSVTTFKGCWSTAPSGPIQGGGCWTLDAHECSRHDDCSLYYGYGYDAPIPPNAVVAPSFDRCGPEPTTQGCAAVDCGPGSHCEDQCYPCDGKTGPCDPQCSPVCVPDAPTCAAVDCAPGYTCIETCTGMDPTSGGDGGAISPSHCYAQCVPDGGGDPGSCTGSAACDAPAPACPANTTAGLLNGCWTGYCIPNSACGPNDPGSCTGQAICAMPPPACPSGTVPGQLAGCWSGYCIPQSDCPVAACETLTTESSCLARTECTPVYGGSNCTCSPSGGCTCQDLAYERCETWWL